MTEVMTEAEITFTDDDLAYIKAAIAAEIKQANIAARRDGDPAMAAVAARFKVIWDKLARIRSASY